MSYGTSDRGLTPKNPTGPEPRSFNPFHCPIFIFFVPRKIPFLALWIFVFCVIRIPPRTETHQLTASAGFLDDNVKFFPFVGGSSQFDSDFLTTGTPPRCVRSSWCHLSNGMKNRVACCNFVTFPLEKKYVKIDNRFPIRHLFWVRI